MAGAHRSVPAEGLVRTLAVGVGAWSQEAGAPQLREGPALVAVVGADVIVLKLRAQLRVWPRVFVQGLCGLGELIQVAASDPDEMTSSQFITDALKDVEAELNKGTVQAEEAVGPNPPGSTAQGADQGSQPKRRKVIVDFEEVSDEKEGDSSSGSSSEVDEDTEARERRAKLLEDVPFSVQRNLAERRKRQEEASMDPHALDFVKKQRMHEALSKTFGAPTKLQEGELRNRMEQAYAQVRSVRKVIRRKGKDELPKKGRQAR